MTNQRSRIRENIVAGKRLGRHRNHDPRSLHYLYPAHRIEKLVSVRHKRRVPVLDQGRLGSCTGNAAEGACGTSPLYEAIPATTKARPTGDAELDERQAIALYSAATHLDGFDGAYPPHDTGSDGLSVAKAALKAGLISGYTHCTSLNAALAALSRQPVITGVNWYDSFDAPTADGLITISKHASLRGGHEFVLDELDVEHKLVGFTNSWGPIWGLSGRAYIGFDDFGRLLDEHGDVTVFTPLSQPAPAPALAAEPSPDPDEELPGCLSKLLPLAWIRRANR